MEGFPVVADVLQNGVPKLDAVMRSSPKSRRPVPKTISDQQQQQLQLPPIPSPATVTTTTTNQVSRPPATITTTTNEMQLPPVPLPTTVTTATNQMQLSPTTVTTTTVTTTTNQSSSSSSSSSSSLQNGTMIISPSHEFDHADALSLLKSARSAGLFLPENANYIFLPPGATNPQQQQQQAPPPLTTPTDPASLTSPEASVSRKRKRLPTSTKKFVTKKFPSLNQKTEKNETNSNLMEEIKNKKTQNSSIFSSVSKKRRKGEDEPIYEIEKILKKAMKSGHRVRYLVKWVGSEETTWEPRRNFASDNEAWLTFKREQAEKKQRSGKQNKRTSGEKERVKPFGDGSDRTDSDRTVADRTVSVSETEEEEEEEGSVEILDRVTRSSVAPLKKQLAERSTSNGSSLKFDEFISQSSMLTPQKKALDTLLAFKAPSTQLDKVARPVFEVPIVSGASSGAVVVSLKSAPSAPSTPSAPSPSSSGVTPLAAPPPKPMSPVIASLRPIAPLPRAGETLVRMTQEKQGDMIVYVPSSVAGPSSTLAFEVTTPRYSICTPAVSGSRPLSVVSSPRAAPSPELQTPKNYPKIIVRTSAGSTGTSGPVVLAPPGTLSVTSSRPVSVTSSRLAPVTSPRPMSATSSGSVAVTLSRPIPVTSSGKLVSVAPSINGPAAQRLPVPQLANPVGGVSNAPYRLVQLPVLTNGPTGLPANRPMGSVLPGPTRPAVRPPVSVMLRLPPQKVMRSVGTNTMMSLVSAKDVTVHAGSGRSGLDHGDLVVNIAGFRPRQVAVTCLDDIAFLVTYANRDSEFVDYQECIRKIPHEVAEFLFKNKIHAVDATPLRFLP